MLAARGITLTRQWCQRHFSSIPALSPVMPTARVAASRSRASYARQVHHHCSTPIGATPIVSRHCRQSHIVAKLWCKKAFRLNWQQCIETMRSVTENHGEKVSQKPWWKSVTENHGEKSATRWKSVTKKPSGARVKHGKLWQWEIEAPCIRKTGPDYVNPSVYVSQCSK